VLNKTLLGLSLVAAFSTASLVQADEYHVVVPAPGKAAPYASIKLELNPASLPVGFVGDAYADLISPRPFGLPGILSLI